MTDVPSGAVLAVLDALEESDARNLAWGLPDESWTKDGLIAFLAKHWAEVIRGPASRNSSRPTS